jgi:glycosyltransferase involved in cell wall biosynthesis
MKVALVTGLCPPGRDGPGDYIAHLSKALAASGVEARVIASEDWRVVGAFKVRDSLQDFDLVHIQYPTLGFGYRLGPQVLSLLRGCVITIQEASQRRILRKLSLLPFLVRPRHVIFLDDFERRYVITRAPWVARISSIILTPGNIRVFPQERPRTLGEIVYFGLILPRKGLEEVVELSRLIKSGGLPLRVRIIGGRRLEHLKYLEKLRSVTAELPVIWDLDLSEEQVAEKLASSAVAYLPYPDGVSERRSTFKAALANGVAVVTTLGSQTPEDMQSFLRFARTPQEALITARSLLESPEERAKLARNAGLYLQQYSWERAAEEHLAVYQNLLNPMRGSASVKVENP